MKSYLEQRLAVKSFSNQNDFSDFQIECILALGDNDYTSNLETRETISKAETNSLTGIRVSDLASLLKERTSSNTSQTLGRLEERFIVYRLDGINCEKIKKQDRRKKEVLLTSYGSELYHQIKSLLG